MRGDDPIWVGIKRFHEWPDCLKSALRLSLSSHAQIALFIGSDFHAFYNDAFATVIADKHPGALCSPVRDHWPEIWDELAPMLQSVMTGKTVSARNRRFMLHRSGQTEEGYFDFSFSPVANEAGTIFGVFCIVSETTERLRNERALRESESRLRVAVDGASAGIASIGASGTILLANSHFAEILGARAVEITGRTLSDLLDPDVIGVVHRMRAAQGIFPMPKELRLRRRDGSFRWVSLSVGQINGAPLVAANEAAIYCLVILDVTAKRRETAQARQMAAIINGSEDAILGVGLDMRITSWNDGATKLYGYSQSDVLHRSIAFLLPPDRKDEETEILQRIRRGERVESYETTRIRKDGKEVSVSLTVSPMLDEDGQLVGASKIARDISARKEAERMQAILMREMQHRVKNILATVLAIARQSFGGLRHAAVVNFTDRIYALARAQNLLTRAAKDGANLADLVGEVLSPYQPSQISISGLDVPLPSEVVLTLTLALHELATNAAKYGALSVPEGRVLIEWQAEYAAEGKRNLHLSWRESGGPKVITPQTNGFGTVLVRDILSAELQADISLIHHPEGVQFKGLIPLPGESDCPVMSEAS